MLRVFYSPGAASLVTNIALEESDAEFEAVRVAITGGRTRLRRISRSRVFFGDIETLLSRGDWLLGHRYTAADGYPLTFLRWARRQKFDTAPYRRWTAHARRTIDRPAVRRSIAREALDPSEF